MLLPSRDGPRTCTSAAMLNRPDSWDIGCLAISSLLTQLALSESRLTQTVLTQRNGLRGQHTNLETGACRASKLKPTCPEPCQLAIPACLLVLAQASEPVVVSGIAHAAFIGSERPLVTRVGANPSPYSALDWRVLRACPPVNRGKRDHRIRFQTAPRRNRAFRRAAGMGWLVVPEPEGAPS